MGSIRCGNTSRYCTGLLLFFQPTPSLEGIWVGPADSTAVVYELNQEEPRSNGKYKIEKVYKGKEASQEFQKALNQLNYSS